MFEYFESEKEKKKSMTAQQKKECVDKIFARRGADEQDQGRA
jgi:hypothetical protein